MKNIFNYDIMKEGIFIDKMQVFLPFFDKYRGGYFFIEKWYFLPKTPPPLEGFRFIPKTSVWIASLTSYYFLSTYLGIKLS
jgi:hypothetical protein